MKSFFHNLLKTSRPVLSALKDAITSRVILTSDDTEYYKVSLSMLETLIPGPVLFLVLIPQ